MYFVITFSPEKWYFGFSGHTVKAVCETFQLAKDSGFKVVVHMMPDLPNVDFDRDVDQFIVSYWYYQYLCLFYFKPVLKI